MTDLMRANVQFPDKMDLSPQEGRLPLKLRLALGQIFGNVPGVHLEDARIIGSAPSSQLVRFTFKGWSPSLHAIRYSITTKVEEKPGHPDYPSAVAVSTDEVLKKQIARQRAAMEYGLAFPLPVGADASSREKHHREETIEKRHLTVETSLIVMSLLSGVDISKEIDEDLGIIHHIEQKEDSDYVSNNTTFALICGLGHLVGTQVYHEINPRISVDSDGLSLDIRGQVAPETILTQMPGRRLGELIKIHPELDRRIVLTADGGGLENRDRMRIRLVPEVVPFTRLEEIRSQYSRS